MATDKFMNKYRIASARKLGWDYSAEGLYFITICTAVRIYWFGNIENQQMHFSEMGNIVLHEWEKSFTLRTESPCAPPKSPRATPEPNNGIAIRKPKSISSFVAGFKSAATTIVRKKNIEFAWQSRFHDHIIRNDAEYQRIFNYINNNPKNWEKDKIFGG